MIGFHYFMAHMTDDGTMVTITHLRRMLCPAPGGKLALAKPPPPTWPRTLGIPRATALAWSDGERSSRTPQPSPTRSWP